MSKFHVELFSETEMLGCHLQRLVLSFSLVEVRDIPTGTQVFSVLFFGLLLFFICFSFGLHAVVLNTFLVLGSRITLRGVAVLGLKWLSLM